MTFEVRDNGPGFSAEALRRAGELFYTQDGGAAAAILGLGLPLRPSFALGAGGCPEAGKRAPGRRPGEPVASAAAARPGGMRFGKKGGLHPFVLMV